MDLNRYILKMRLNKMQKCGISGPLIWSEVNRNLTAVQGYLVTQGTACWHVWCQDTQGEIQDVGWELAKREDAAFANIDKEYIMIPPEGMQVDKDIEVAERWDKYQQDPKGYWKTEPMDVQTFRAKIIRETKQPQ
jgi:hypothetical protein|tara:strand:- start:19 stop:423 length:405 start_codon:yes stop_codon:yes gene_type:complete